jgi:hypothetical protein
MTVDKLSVSFDHELGDAVRAAASEVGQALSSWLADAAAKKLRAVALARFWLTGRPSMGRSRTRSWSLLGSSWA